MSLSRRDALKGLIGASAVAVTQADPTALMAGEPVSKLEAMRAFTYGDITNPAEKMAGECVNQLKAEVAEIKLYRDRLVEVRQKLAEDPNRTQLHEPAKGVSLPYATFPINFYAKLTKVQLSIPEPKIPNLHAGMAQGWGAWQVQTVLHLLTRDWRMVPAGATLLGVNEDITLTLPDGTPCPRDRVVSPKYVIDVDEPHFGMRTTANMIIDSVDGIWYEWDCKMQEARKHIKLGEPNEFKCTGVIEQHLQVREISVSLVKEAYMLEFFAWNTGAGWAKGHTA